MKVYYFNDEQKPITVKVQRPQHEWDYVVLQPCEARVFEVDVNEETQILWVKKWTNMIMFSSCDKGSLREDEGA